MPDGVSLTPPPIDWVRTWMPVKSASGAAACQLAMSCALAPLPGKRLYQVAGAAAGAGRLLNPVSMATSRTLTVAGRLDCAEFTVGGAGKLIVNVLGTLATATTSATGVAATVVATGPTTYVDGSISEYNAVITGTWVARKGGLSPKQIFNTRDVDEVGAFLAERRRARLSS